MAQSTARKNTRPVESGAEEGSSFVEPPEIPTLADRMEAADKAVEELNKRYAFIEAVGSKTAILDLDALDADGRLIEDVTMKKRTANRKVDVYQGMSKHGNPIFKQLPTGEVWLEHPERKEYRAVDFLPGASSVPAEIYNLWKGWGIEMDGPVGDFSLYREHVLENVCGGDMALYEWVMDWTAALFQHPMRKCGTACVMTGEQGVGKTWLWERIGVLMGAHYAKTADADYAVGNFNSGIEDKILVQMEEALASHDQIKVNKLKDRITAEVGMINRKYAPSYQARTCDHYVFTTNEANPVKVEKGDRRFAVFAVGSARKEDHAFFQAATEELERDNMSGYRALLIHLLARSIDWKRIKHPPRNSARTEMMKRSLTGLDAWWFDLLDTGVLPGARNAHGFIPAENLADSFLHTIRDASVNGRSAAMAVSDHLKKLEVPGLEKKKMLLTLSDGSTSMRWHYRLPSLRECREHLQEKMTCSDVWTDMEMDEAWEEMKTPLQLRMIAR